MAEWVTGPALDIIIAMKAIQPGDKVKLKPYKGEHSDEHLSWWTKKWFYVASIDDDPYHPINLTRHRRYVGRRIDGIGCGSANCCAWGHLAAWQRPLKKEKANG